jgi:hypothetical protein
MKSTTHASMISSIQISSLDASDLRSICVRRGPRSHGLEPAGAPRLLSLPAGEDEGMRSRHPLQALMRHLLATDLTPVPVIEKNGQLMVARKG